MSGTVLCSLITFQKKGSLQLIALTCVAKVYRSFTLILACCRPDDAAARCTVEIISLINAFRFAANECFFFEWKVVTTEDTDCSAHHKRIQI